MAEHLRGMFGCNTFRPYLNARKPDSDHLLAIEICWCICALIQLGLAAKTRRILTWIGILVFGAVFESLGHLTRSHAHNQFRLQVTCYLPLKEVFWYGNTIFMGVIVAENSGVRSIFLRSVLAATLAGLQNFSYEMVNAKPGVNNVYMNSEDFAYADFTDQINGAITAVALSVTILAFSSSVVVFSMDKSSLLQVVAIPCLGVLLGVAIHNAVFSIKYVGCTHFWQSERSWEDFHNRCLKYSTLTNSSVLSLACVMVSLFLLQTAKSRDVNVPQLDSVSKYGVLVVALISHGAILYNLLEGARLIPLETPTQTVIFCSVALLQIGLIHIMLVGGLGSFSFQGQRRGTRTSTKKTQ